MRSIFSCVFLLLILLAQVANGQTAQDDKPLVKPAEKEAVPIKSTIDKDMFPKFWVTDKKIAAYAKPATSKRFQRARDLTRVEMKRYPTKLLKRCLDRVYIVGELGFSGVTVGGTNSSSRVFMVSGPIKSGYTDAYLKGVFHHEFSSILLRRHRNTFPKNAWLNANPKEFSYQGNGTQAVADGKSSESYDQELSKKGFISQYATASFEEDFNSVATRLMMGDRELSDAAASSPPIAAKVKITHAFYKSLGIQVILPPKLAK